jgi:DNA-binding response OmpR family regulator
MAETLSARILLVEDDPDVRPLLQHVLLAERHQVDIATTLAEADDLLAREQFDLVLTDIGLPDGSGLALAERATRRGVRTLVLTGYALRLSARELDGYDFLMKPIRPRELIDAVERCLGPGTRC